MLEGHGEGWILEFGACMRGDAESWFVTPPLGIISHQRPHGVNEGQRPRLITGIGCVGISSDGSRGGSEEMSMVVEELVGVVGVPDAVTLASGAKTNKSDWRQAMATAVTLPSDLNHRSASAI